MSIFMNFIDIQISYVDSIDIHIYIKNKTKSNETLAKRNINE